MARKIPERQYNGALLEELEAHSVLEDWRGRKLKSIYFGGGTPSTFSPASIGRTLDRAESLFGIDGESEISLEANPGMEDSGNFSGYRGCGVNRLSIGVQSFQPHLLRFLGRLHSPKETRRALRIARKAGFENFNIDLIYGSPRQTISDLKADLEEALSFHPSHLSAYNLTIEEGTPFYRQYRAGRLKPMAEEIEIAMVDLIEETLSRAGLGRYEISNYARPGRQSRHNLNYWQGGDYLGIGAGAHSYKRGEPNGSFGHRWHNEKNPGRYMQRVERHGEAVAERYQTDLRMAAGEFMFLGLRVMQGISPDEFFSRFGRVPKEFYPQIGDWMNEGLMEENGNRLRLTRRGLQVADSIFVAFV